MAEDKAKGQEEVEYGPPKPLTFKEVAALVDYAENAALTRLVDEVREGEIDGTWADITEIIAPGTIVCPHCHGTGYLTVVDHDD